MVLIITHSDHDGAMCAGLLGQEFPEADIYVQVIPIRDIEDESNHNVWHWKYYQEKIVNKILKNREKDLIIIADIGIVEVFKKAIIEKLEKSPNIRFIIFDHHIEPNITHPRVQVYFEEVNNAYEIIRRWKRARAGLPPKKRWKKKP